MSYPAIKAKIVARVQTLVDTNDATKLQSVYDYGVRFMQEEVKAYPIAVVIPNEETSQYWSKDQNQRVYVFKVYIIFRCEATVLRTAHNAVEAIADQILDLFDVDSNNDLDDTIAFIDATTSSFEQRSVSESDVAVVASVMLRCNQLKNVQS